MAIQAKVCTQCSHAMKYWLGSCVSCGGKNVQYLEAADVFDLDRKLKALKPQKKAFGPFSSAMLASMIIALCIFSTANLKESLVRIRQSPVPTHVKAVTAKHRAAVNLSSHKS